MFTKSQIATLNKARAELGEVRTKLEVTGDGFLHGRLSEACNIADLALMAVINLTETMTMLEEMRS